MDHGNLLAALTIPERKRDVCPKRAHAARRESQNRRGWQRPSRLSPPEAPPFAGESPGKVLSHSQPTVPPRRAETTELEGSGGRTRRQPRTRRG